MSDDILRDEETPLNKRENPAERAVKGGTTMKHTEWELDFATGRLTKGKEVIAIVSGADRAESEFIVRACNSRDDLLEACKAMKENACYICRIHNPQHADCTWCQDVDSTIKAIAKAKGE